MLDESFDGEVPSEQPDRGGEELRVVAAQLRGCRRDGGAAEVDDTEPAVVEDEVVLVELAVRDPVVVECREQCPELTEPTTRLVAGEDRGGGALRVTEPVGFDEQRAGTPQHEHRIVGVRGSCDHDRVGGDTGLRGEQRQQGLVFDLTKSTEADGGAWLAEPDGSPHGRDERSIVGVAPVQLDDQVTAVGAAGGDGEVAGVLTVGGAEFGHLDLHVRQCEPDVVEARPPGARPDGQVHDRCRAGGREQRLRAPRASSSLRAPPRRTNRGR